MSCVQCGSAGPFYSSYKSRCVACVKARVHARYEEKHAGRAPCDNGATRNANGQFESTQTIEERFWSKVDRSGPVMRAGLEPCWLWTAARDKRTGYGVFALPEEPAARASRVAWTLTFGEIPSGMLVRHVCDNPPCVRPGHLLLGTVADNSRDCVERGRSARGERHGRAVMTQEKADALRVERAEGMTQLGLASKYGISRATVRQILDGLTWKSPSINGVRA